MSVGPGDMHLRPKGMVASAADAWPGCWRSSSRSPLWLNGWRQFSIVPVGCPGGPHRYLSQRPATLRSPVILEKIRIRNAPGPNRFRLTNPCERGRRCRSACRNRGRQARLCRRKTVAVLALQEPGPRATGQAAPARWRWIQQGGREYSTTHPGKAHKGHRKDTGENQGDRSALHH